MSKIGKVVVPGQNVPVDTPQGVDPVWFERFKQLATFANLFSEIDPATLTNNQVLLWDLATKKFKAGAN